MDIIFLQNLKNQIQQIYNTIDNQIFNEMRYTRSERLRNNLRGNLRRDLNSQIPVRSENRLNNLRNRLRDLFPDHEVSFNRNYTNN